MPQLNTSSTSSTADMIPNTVEIYSLIGFQIFVLISSLFGDVIILIATITENNFRLNKLIIVVIQHIAINDLAISLIWVLPGTVNMISMAGWNYWILNPSSLASVLRYSFIHYLFSVSMYLVSALVTTKFIILKFPLRIQSWTKTRAHTLCVTIWVVTLSKLICTFFIVDRRKPILSKNMAIYDCRDKTLDLSSWSYLFETAVTILLPILVVILTTIPTLHVLLKGREAARRAGGEVRWQGILTVVLTAGILCLSCLPYFVFVYAQKYSPGLITDHFKRLAWYLPLLNIVSNFYIYCLTVVSFRRFLLSKLRSSVSFLQQDSPEQVTELEMGPNPTGASLRLTTR